MGNWEIAPIYTYQTGNWYTVQAGTDANLNGDSGGDRAIVVPGGNPDIGSGTKALKNSTGDTVAFLATTAGAGYITTPKGALATAARNTMRMHPIDNIDATIAKNIAIGERFKLQLAGRFYNIFNHPQYTGGSINDVQPIGATGSAQHSFVLPSSSYYNQDSLVFSSNPRALVVSGKLNF